MTAHEFEWSDLIHIVQAIGNLAAVARFALKNLPPARGGAKPKSEGRASPASPTVGQS